MKFLRNLGFSFLGLVLIVLILGLFAPKEVATEQSIGIMAAPAAVHAVVNDLETWDQWSAWSTNDPTLKMTFGETTVGEGASYDWTSENSGEGTMNIVGSWDPDSLHNEIDFGGMGAAQAQFIFAPEGAGSYVTWKFHTRTPFPFNVMTLFVPFKEDVDRDFRQGLEQLKTLVEGMDTAPTYTVKEVEFPATHYIADRDQVALADLDDHFQKRMPALGMAVGESGLEMTGMPAGIYYGSGEEIDLALAIPVTAGAEVEDFITIDIATGPALQIDYYGNYDGLTAAHEAMSAYLLEKGLVPKMPFIETYKTDPGDEPDPSKWLTEVVYFVEN